MGTCIRLLKISFNFQCFEFFCESPAYSLPKSTPINKLGKIADIIAIAKWAGGRKRF